MNDPFIVMCAPNGARKSKADHSRLPVSPDELAECSVSILEAGASIIHLHVRDARGEHSLDAGRYSAAIAAIRKRTGSELVIQITTEACGIYTAAEQMQAVRDVRPEAVSVALKEICPDPAAEASAAKFYTWMNAENVMAQHILYSPDEVRRFESLRSRGVIDAERPFVLYVLGRYASSQTGDVGSLDDFIAASSADAVWAVCCFGQTESVAAERAAALGGHARVGFENNLLLPDGSAANDNAALVRIAAESGLHHARSPATADDVRSLFG